MINCFIVDDEKSCIDLLRKYIEVTPDLSIAGTETNPVNALNLISTGKVKADVAFLDIKMPGLTGIELALQIRAFCKIVFTSVHSDYGVKAFDIEAFDFLLKPVTYERFSQTIRRLNSKEKVGCNNDQYLFIKGNKKNVWQRLEPVGTLYIESSHNYSIIHSENLTKQTVYLNLAEIEEALSPYKFLRIQKSFIINVKRISKIEGSSVFLQGMDTPLICGKNFRPALMAAIDSRILSHKDNLTGVSRH